MLKMEEVKKNGKMRKSSTIQTTFRCPQCYIKQPVQPWLNLLLKKTNLESSILQNLLDSNNFISVTQTGLIYHTEWAISNNFNVCVWYFLCFVALAQRRNNGYNFTVFSYTQKAKLKLTIYQNVRKNKVKSTKIRKE